MLHRPPPLLIMLAAAIAMHGQTIVTIGDYSVTTSHTPSFPVRGASLDVQVTKADLTSAGGKPVRDDMSHGVLVTVFDPGSGLFWWCHQGTRANPDLHLQAQRFTEAHKFAITAREIISFSALGHSLFVRSSTERFSDHKSGSQKTLANLEKELPKLVFGDRGSKQIPLPFDNTFYAFGPAPGSMLSEKGSLMNLKIQSIEQVATRWRVEITNERNEVRSVLLTPGFEVIHPQPGH